jgi:hypothetical protein
VSALCAASVFVFNIRFCYFHETVYLSLSVASACDIGVEDLAEITTLVVRKKITLGGLFSLKHGFFV